MLLFGPWGGMLADRYSKRKLLIITQAFMGAVALVLGGLVLTGVVAVWHVYVLALLLGLGTALDNPARQSFVIEMVGRDDLPNAVGLNSALVQPRPRDRPGAGRPAHRASFGTGPVFLINAAVLRRRHLCADPPARRRASPRRRGRAAGRAMLEGIRYVRGRPDLLTSWCGRSSSARSG